MAENIRFQRSGIMYAEFPTLQYANIQEEIKQARSLNASLDRISEFAYKGAVKKAEEAGMQYGIQNAPTLKQVMDSIKDKQKPADLFQSGDTTFGEAARKVQVATFRTELEREARSAFTDIDAVVNSGNPYNMQEIDDELNGIVDGHSKVLAGIDPEESAKYRQSITILGSATRKNALDRVAKRIEAENLGKVEDEMDNLKKQVPLLFDTYPIFEDYKLIESQLQASVNEMITRIDPTKIPEKTQQMKQIFKDAAADHIGKYLLNDKTFAGTPGEASLKIMEGQAGDKTQLLNDYFPTDDDKMKIVKKITEKKVSQANLIESSEKLDKKIKEDDYRIIMRDYHEGKVGPEETIGALKAKNIPISNDEYKAITTAQEETPGNLETYSKMVNRVNVDLLSVGEIDAAVKGKRITYKQALALKDKYFTRTDSDKEIKRGILNKLNISSPEMLMLKPELDVVVAKSYTAIKKEVDDLRVKGLPVNMAEIVNKNTALIVEVNSTEGYKEAQGMLKKITSKYNIEYSETAYNIKDIDKKFRKTMSEEDRRDMKNALGQINTFNQQQKNKASF
jgi:hypothetical protein